MWTEILAFNPPMRTRKKQQSATLCLTHSLPDDGRGKDGWKLEQVEAKRCEG